MDDTITILSTEEEQKKDIQKEESSNIVNNENLQQTLSLKRKRSIKGQLRETQLPNTEETLRIERIKRVMDEEQRLVHIKQNHEVNISNLKENHLKEMYKLELQHLKVIQMLEIDIKKAQLKAIVSKGDKENIRD